MIDNQFRLARWYRQQYGVYKGSEWGRFLHDHGMTYIELEIPYEVPAVRFKNTIYLSPYIGAADRAFYVWHECSHGILHPGGSRWWRTRPQGNITVLKQEWQADWFAILFPEWEQLPPRAYERLAALSFPSTGRI